jgi:hypothetical protein
VPFPEAVPEFTTPMAFPTARQVTFGKHPLVQRGFYNPLTNTVYLGEKGRTYAKTVIHEIGHAIWFRDMTPEQRQEWFKLDPEGGRGVGSLFSATSSFQNFAEDWARFLLQPTWYRTKFPDRYRFMVRLSGMEPSPQSSKLTIHKKIGRAR